MPARLIVSQQKYNNFATKIVNRVLASSHKKVDEYLNEHGGMIDAAFVEKLTSELKRKASHKLGARAIENNFFSDRRTLVPIYDGSGLYRSRYVEIDLRDIPNEYLDIDKLVPDFQNLVNNTIEERKRLYEQEQMKA